MVDGALAVRGVVVTPHAAVVAPECVAVIRRAELEVAEPSCRGVLLAARGHGCKGLVLFGGSLVVLQLQESGELGEQVVIKGRRAWRGAWVAGVSVASGLGGVAVGGTGPGAGVALAEALLLLLAVTLPGVVARAAGSAVSAGRGRETDVSSGALLVDGQAKRVDVGRGVLVQ